MEAQVILLPKPGKDQLACSSYTPIALLNQDLKILTKILATRLSKVIYTLVAIDQIGFIPQSTDTNLRRLFIHLQTDHANPGARVVSLDMAKAFDSMDWNYMSAVLRHMGFGDVFRTWISLLYSKPMAAIKLGTSVSPQFAVCRGTHQGCPLSPSLFALAIDTCHSAQEITLCEGIRGGKHSRMYHLVCRRHASLPTEPRTIFRGSL